jgi:hypothetical protein
MTTQTLESAAVFGSGNIESDVMTLLADANVCAARWMKDHVLSLARSEPIIRNGNGIARKLMYIFEREHTMNDSDFNPSPGYLDFSVLADCTPDAQAAILRGAAEQTSMAMLLQKQEGMPKKIRFLLQLN